MSAARPSSTKVRRIPFDATTAIHPVAIWMPRLMRRHPTGGGLKVGMRAEVRSVNKYAYGRRFCIFHKGPSRPKGESMADQGNQGQGNQQNQGGQRQGTQGQGGQGGGQQGQGNQNDRDRTAGREGQQ